jgi:hypothetical protein
MVLAPHWIDAVIDEAVKKGDAEAVVYALTHSNQLLKAALAGIEEAKKPQPANTMGPSRTQIVRRMIVEAVDNANAPV